MGSASSSYVPSDSRPLLIEGIFVPVCIYVQVWGGQFLSDKLNIGEVVKESWCVLESK